MGDKAATESFLPPRFDTFSREMAVSKKTLWSIVALVITVSVLLASYLMVFQLAKPGGLQLELGVTPNGIPRSGSLTVTSSLYNWTSETRIVIDSTVVMNATLDDGTRTSQTKNTTDGQVSFAIPPNTVAISFDACCQNNEKTYTASVTLSESSVVSESLATGIAVPAAIAGFGLAGAGWIWYGGGKVNSRRFLVAVPGLIAGGLPLIYLIQNYPNWFGTGWFPYSFYGFPVWGFVPVTVVGGLLSGVLGKSTRKVKPSGPAEGKEKNPKETQ